MKKINNFKKFSLLFVIFIVSYMLYGAAYKPQQDIFEKINRNLDIFGNLYKNLSLDYVDELDVDKFMRAGIDGMLSTLDPYTVFYDENSKSEIDLITLGKFAGIGVTIEQRDSSVVITDVLQGYQADKKGLKDGDIILEIDGVNISGMKLDRIRKMVRGEAGTSVNFKIERNGGQVDLALVREEINLKNIPYYGFAGNENDGIGYIKLDRFTNTADNEVENAIKTLKAKQNLSGLVIDLRGNGGGLLEEAIGILNKLVNKNSLLLITKGKNADKDEKFFSKSDPIIPASLPLIILINKQTASASEIVAGAVQDLDRGLIIGSRSFGKGLVQQIKDLPYDTKMKLTTRRYFTPSGRWIQEKNYFKENKYGVFMDKLLLQQSEFKTLNGRTVYAYGGISPDVETETDVQSDVYLSLLSQDAFFKFANYYLALHPALTSFSCTDEVFNDFLGFLRSSGISYISAESKKLNEVKAAADKKQYDEAFYAKLSELGNIISGENYNELAAHKDELKRAIEIQIRKQIYPEDERIAASLDTDPAVVKAIYYIQNITEYNKLLNK